MKINRRQAIRKGLLLVSLLLFPIIINYMSPYLIIDSASNGIINGSFIVFSIMLIGSLFLGRLWCGWVCPMAGLGESCLMVQNKPAPGGKWNWIKWGIWFPWVAIIAAAAIAADGYQKIDFFYLTENYISIDRPQGWIIYYAVLLLFLVLALAIGKRAGCHYICWMAPFMIIGRKTRNLFRWPSLRLVAESEKCKDCKRCTANCPMSLNVNQMVHMKDMENSECVLCGSCVDVCPDKVIRFTFKPG